MKKEQNMCGETAQANGVEVTAICNCRQCDTEALHEHNVETEALKDACSGAYSLVAMCFTVLNISADGSLATFRRNVLPPSSG
jgi:hypothetical protein